MGGLLRFGWCLLFESGSGSAFCPCRVVVFRGRVSARRPTRFLVARQESGAKKRAPNCPRPFASLRATCVGRDAGCAAELALRFARRSNNCGKSDDEAALSFGRAATPHPAQRRRGQKGEAGEQPTANSQQPTANSQQPAPSLRSASNQGPSEAKALTNSPYVSACGVVVAGLQSCRRTGLLRDLTRCGCLSGVHAVNAASSAANPATATTQVARSEAEGRGHPGRLCFAYFPLAKQRKVGRPPGRDPASKRNPPAGPEPASAANAAHAANAAAPKNLRQPT